MIQLQQDIIKQKSETLKKQIKYQRRLLNIEAKISDQLKNGKKNSVRKFLKDPSSIIF